MTADAIGVESAEAMVELGHRIGARLSAGDLVILDGPLGAGKTTLARGIGDGLNVRGPVTSPTFVIARVHPSLTGGPALVHVDAYRLASLADIDSLDLDESLDDCVTVVEWGRGRVERLASSWLTLELSREPGRIAALGEPGETDLAESRRVVVTGYGPLWRERAAKLANEIAT